jgi:hypothetical protein
MPLGIVNTASNAPAASATSSVAPRAGEGLVVSGFGPVEQADPRLRCCFHLAMGPEVAAIAQCS